MNETQSSPHSHLEANDLIFHTDEENNIYAGGFSVQSAMMKAGIRPIMTYNDSYLQEQDVKGGAKKVSDLFQDLVVPSWLTSYGSISMGDIYGGSNEVEAWGGHEGDTYNNERSGHSDNEDSASDDENSDADTPVKGGARRGKHDVVEDDLFDQLLDLVRYDASEEKTSRKNKIDKKTKRRRKSTKQRNTKRVRRS